MWLAIDTTTKRTLIAVIDDDGTIALERNFESKATQKLIFGELASILDPDTLAQLDGIAVGTGPGSFTGVKIGVIAAKALAWSRALSLVGIGSLDVVAAGLDLKTDSGTHLAVAVTSTKGEIYLRLYEPSGNTWLPIGPIHDIPLDPDIILPLLPGRTIIASGGAADSLTDTISNHVDITTLDEYLRYPSAKGFVKLATGRFESGQFDDPLTLAPEYIRPSQPERLEKGGS